MCVRGGFPRADRKKSDAPKLNWTRDVFTRLANHTDTHKATSVGHDLITHYQNYLAEYEDEHPEDVSVPDAGDDPVEFERCEPKPTHLTAPTAERAAQLSHPPHMIACERLIQGAER